MDINISPYLTDALPPGLTMSPSDLHEIKAVPADAQGSLMSSFSVAKKPRKTRAKFSKVRTGCITCTFYFPPLPLCPPSPQSIVELSCPRKEIP